MNLKKEDEKKTAEKKAGNREKGLREPRGEIVRKPLAKTGVGSEYVPRGGITRSSGRETQKHKVIGGKIDKGSKQ